MASEKLKAVIDTATVLEQAKSTADAKADALATATASDVEAKQAVSDALAAFDTAVAELKS